MQANENGSTGTLKSNQLQVSLLLLLADVLGMYVAFNVALTIRRWLIPSLGGVIRLRPAQSLTELGMLLAVLVFWLYHLYPGYGLTAVRELESLIKALTLVFVFLTISAYLLRIEEIKDFSRLTFLFAWVISIVLIAVLRFAIRNRLSLSSFYGMPVIVIGLGTHAATRTLIASARSCRRMGWRAQAAWIPESSDTGTRWKITLLNSREEVDRMRKNVELALVTMPATNEDAEKNRLMLYWLSQRFKRVVLFHEISGLGSVWVETRDLEGWLGLEMQYHLLDPRAVWVKRTTDILGSAGLLVLLSPFMILISLLIAIDSRGPIFYGQERTGQNFCMYKIWKFRTMVVDADKKLHDLLESDSQAREEFERFHKLKADPRITRVGKWLRRFSLDEISQLWNVLKGDMSLVGPRGGLPSELLKAGPLAAIILRVKPGMTGWWQVTRGRGTTFERRLQMDEYYISNWSLWMDFFILLKTFWIVVSGSGI